MAPFQQTIGASVSERGSTIVPCRPGPGGPPLPAYLTFCCQPSFSACSAVAAPLESLSMVEVAPAVALPAKAVFARPAAGRERPGTGAGRSVLMDICMTGIIMLYSALPQQCAV